MHLVLSQKEKRKLTWVQNRLQFSRNEWEIRLDAPMNLAVLSQGLSVMILETYLMRHLIVIHFGGPSQMSPTSDIFPWRSYSFPPDLASLCAALRILQESCVSDVFPFAQTPQDRLASFLPSQNWKLKLRKGKNILNPTQQWEGGLDSDLGLASEAMLFYTSVISIWKFTWIFSCSHEE